MDSEYVKLMREMEEMKEKHMKNIAILVIVFLLIGLVDNRYINIMWKEKSEENYEEVYRITQEMKEKVYELAEENDNFIRDYEEVIELAGEEDYHKYVIDDFHTSAAFEEAIHDFEFSLERIEW